MKIQIIFYIFIISLIFSYAALHANTNGFSRERQYISVNLLPSYSIIFPPLANNLFNNIKTFAGLAKIDISPFSAYMDNMNLKGSFWYVPNISYSFMFTRRVGIELAIGVQSTTYYLNIPKDKAHNLIESIPGEISNYYGVVGGDSTFKASFVHIPISAGLKILAGKNYDIVNVFRIGVETLVYNVETLNGITGMGTKRHTTDAAVYVSYELGWHIDLFPNKNWRVKPYIDISLFEIGYYVRSVNEGIYNDVKEGVDYFTMGLIDLDKYLPPWSELPYKTGIVTALKIGIFPRVGFTIRF